MSPATLKLTLAAVGIVSLLWCGPVLQDEGECKDCARHEQPGR
jgi:hypothetical protein